MGVAGLHESGDAALLDCVRCAIEFIKLPKLLALGCQVRAGVHAGPVVAGKVGQRKYSYDLWGDTVNTAARIQTRAAPETVFVSAAVWKRISNRSTGISQGLVELKGKGQTELFRVDAVALATAAVAKAEPVGAVLAQS
jgi:class 3 adenylate cyclase